MEDLAKYYTANMTEAEKSALVKFQSRINQAGEIEPEKTIIQKAKVTWVKIEGNLPNHDYHYGFENLSYLSAGKLKSCTTPLHYKMALETPTKNSANLNIGSAFHELILEPNIFSWRLFDDTQICIDLMTEGFKSPRATNRYKEWHKQFENEAGELADDVLPKEAFSSMWKLKKVLGADYVVQCLFDGSENEQSLFVEFNKMVKHTGEPLKVKVRPDGLKIASQQDEANLKEFGVKAGDLIIISVKTTLDASPDGFIRQAIKMQYDLSEAFYSDVIASVYPEKNIHTIFLTLEKDGQVFTGHYLLRYCSDEFLQRGREKYQANLEVYCNSKDLTEGYQLATGSTIVMI